MDNYSTNLVGLVKAAGMEKQASLPRGIGRLIARVAKGRKADNIMSVDAETAARELRDILPDLRGANQVKIPLPAKLKDWNAGRTTPSASSLDARNSGGGIDL